MITNFYWKTFLRFCTISLVLLLTLSAVYFAWIYEKPRYEPNRPLFTSYASAAVSVYEYGGPRALLDWITRLEDERHIQMYLLDNSGHDVLNRDLPTDVTEAIKKQSGWKESLPLQFSGTTQSKKKEKIIFTQIISKEGHNYILATALPPPISTSAVSVDTAQNFGIRLFALIGVCGLVCVWITWYLTRPVSKLRLATQEWSTGNLTARIAGNLGHRKDEISALARDLDCMAEHLQRLMDNQKRLLSDISHELRTPLARLQLALGLARQRSGDVVKIELDRIELEAERLNEMIGQILSLVRLDSLTCLEDKEEVNIVELLDQIIKDAEFENKHTDKNIKFESEKVSEKISANIYLLCSALENIIRNALRYTKKNTTVLVQLSQHHQQLKITIRDKGSGVPEDMLTKLFDPFFRVADARDRNTGGYGLGLAIAKRAIELHGGNISAHNAPEGGLIVTILMLKEERSFREK